MNLDYIDESILKQIDSHGYKINPEKPVMEVKMLADGGVSVTYNIIPKDSKEMPKQEDIR